MEENNVLTFYDDNDNEIELEIVDSFEIDDKKYVALATPEDIEGASEESEVYIMRIESESSGEDIFVYIEDENELNAAFDMFKNRCGEEYDIVDE
ncbi:MAG: DUF1292 domain-containing protein [Clostridia bacterium]|nr:DUF1292 domain-containing protein [Clostridia bacterium]